MADDQIEDDAQEQESVSAGKGKLKLIVAVAGVLAILCGGGSYYFLFMRHKADDKRVVIVTPPPVFIDVPELLVNLSSLPGERVQYLKVKIALEVRDQPLLAQIQPTMPRVIDVFQTYMRELRVSDLNGSGGLLRLKEDLTRRVNAAIQPHQVNAVLFKEIIVQ